MGHSRRLDQSVRVLRAAAPGRRRGATAVTGLAQGGGEGGLNCYSLRLDCCAPAVYNTEDKVMLHLHNKNLRNAAMQNLHMKTMPSFWANIGKIDYFPDSPCTRLFSCHLIQRV